MQIAILDDKYKQVHIPVMCKDYLQDVFWAEIMKEPVHIFGLNYQPGPLKVKDVEQFAFSLDFSKDWAEKFDSGVMPLLEAWEKRLKFKRSTFEVGSSKDQRVLIFSQAWAKQPIRISMLTLLLRVGSNYVPGEDVMKFLEEVSTGKRATMMPSYDAGIVRTALPRFKFIWEGRKFPEQKYEDFGAKTMKSIHSGSGMAYYPKTDAEKA
jgi:hypothetical protein